MKKYSLYLFDFDGTLLNTFPGLVIVFKSAFKEIGVNIKDDDVYELSRVPLPESFIKYGGKKEDAEKFRLHIEDVLDDDAVIRSTEKYPEFDELIEYIKNNNINAGIVSSNKCNHIIKIFDHLHVDKNIFKIYIGSDVTPYTKPDPTPINLALEKLGYLSRKDEVIYIGDSNNDCLAAKNAGIDYRLICRENAAISDFPKINNLLDLFR